MVVEVGGLLMCACEPLRLFDGGGDQRAERHTERFGGDQIDDQRYIH